MCDLYTSFESRPIEVKPRKPRPQSARLDVLAMMMAGGSPRKQRPSSPADSLSPCREDYRFRQKKIPRSTVNEVEDDDHLDDSIESIPIDTHEDDIAITFITGDTRTNTAVTILDDRHTKSGSLSASITGPNDDDWFTNEPAAPVSGKLHAHEAGTTPTTPSAQTTTPTPTTPATTKQELDSHVRSPKHWVSAASSHASLPTQAPRCLLLRSHRPSTISVDVTNGASTLPAYDLKQAIRESRLPTDTLQPLDRTLPLSLPRRGRTRHRRSPAQQISPSPEIMGNQHSHHESVSDGAFDHADDRSTHSVLRASRLKAARLPRRSSMNVFKRLDSKSPLPAELSGAIIEVPRAATAPNLDGMVDDDESENDEQERSRARHAHRHSAPSPSMPMHPASPTATLTEESAARPLSASDTITDRRHDDQAEDSPEEDSPAHLRVSALSPTLPVPSPIPEDSPHKYGLKDRMDTPEADSPPPQDIELIKARRRSSGLAIFNEAKTLQSASSFLNGLSTARRRAESRAQSRNATDNSQGATNTAYSSTYQQSLPGTQLSYVNLPASATTSTIHPYSSISHTAFPEMVTEADLDLNIDITNRNLGHPFKSTGFAYAPPMSITQLKCYRLHHRLLPSRNKYAPVECAVCHADDEGQHWSCGWCALRMCGGCRKAFESAGIPGLRERVRGAEMGGY